MDRTLTQNKLFSTIVHKRFSVHNILHSFTFKVKVRFEEILLLTYYLGRHFIFTSLMDEIIVSIKCSSIFFIFN